MIVRARSTCDGVATHWAPDAAEVSLAWQCCRTTAVMASENDSQSAAQTKKPHVVLRVASMGRISASLGRTLGDAEEPRERNAEMSWL